MGGGADPPFPFPGKWTLDNQDISIVVRFTSPIHPNDAHIYVVVHWKLIDKQINHTEERGILDEGEKRKKEPLEREWGDENENE